MLKGMCIDCGVLLTVALMGCSPDQAERQPKDNSTFQVSSAEVAQVPAGQLDPTAVQPCVAGAPQGSSPLAREVDAAFMAMPMSVTQEEAYQILAERFGVSSDSVEAIITRGTMALAGGNTDEVRSAVECIARQFGELHSVIVSGLDFANVGYVDTSFTAQDAEHVRDRVLTSMPGQLEALFEIPSLERIRLTARYPAIDDEGEAAGSRRVALVEVRRDEFDATRDVRTYSGFTAYGEGD